MKILLLGEYSNVHATLAEGLRALGHDVVVASDGDAWKDYPRDVDLRRSQNNKLGGLKYWWRLHRNFKAFQGFDVVQIINPIFLPLKAERHWRFYKQLRENNKAVFLGAFGMDYYYATTALDCHTFRYSDFNIGETIRHSVQNDIWLADWVNGEKGRLNRYIAEDCDGIIAGLYEYFLPYRKCYPDKLAFIPFPVKGNASALPLTPTDKVRFFIGIQQSRTAYKGTDIMLCALVRIVQDYPEKCEMLKVESVPFATYSQLMRDSHVILDQLYSYTPAMNALEAMSQGLIVVGGGEPENYEILHETTLRPIINVEPKESSVYEALKELVLHPEMLPRLSAESIAYVNKHHDYKRVAAHYIEFWSQRMERRSR